MVLNFYSFHRMGPKKGSKRPVYQRNDQDGDDPAENQNSGDGSDRDLANRLETMMSGFFRKLTGVLKNSHGTTSGIGPSRTRAPRNTTNDDDDGENVRRNPQGGEGEEVYYLKEFNRLQPPKFDGLSGPEAAEGWLYHIYSQFKILNAPERMWVGFATLKLEGGALRWWRSISGPNVTIPWVEFDRTFRDRYVSDAYCRAKRDEFYTLFQGKMYVEEYRLKFEELSMYVGGLSDQQKQERFLNSLKAHYRRTMGFTDFPSYKAYVEAALRLDSQYEQTARFMGPPSRKRNNEPRNTWDKGKKSRSSSESSGGNNSSSGGSSGPRTGCFLCSSRDHYAKDCPSRQRGRDLSSSGGRGRRYNSGSRDQ